jgi:ubiquinone/menaquinone biosynthesis C-methylase UbiE
LGIDSSEPSIEIARELYPAGKFQVGNATALAAQFGSNSFDIVVLRHVLEHLPEFDLAMSEALAVAARRAIFVFYLTPRALPLGVSRLDPGHGRPRFHANIYSRAAINRFLSQRSLSWQWFDNLGPSRAGWFANEVNSAVVVSPTSGQ